MFLIEHEIAEGNIVWDLRQFSQLARRVEDHGVSGDKLLWVTRRSFNVCFRIRREWSDALGGLEGIGRVDRQVEKDREVNEFQAISTTNTLSHDLSLSLSLTVSLSPGPPTSNRRRVEISA